MSELGLQAFYIDNVFYEEAFGYIGLIGAFVFMLIQGAYLIIFANLWQQSFISAEESAGCARCGNFDIVFGPFLADVSARIPSHARRVIHSTSIPCLLDADWMLISKMVLAIRWCGQSTGWGGGHTFRCCVPSTSLFLFASVWDFLARFSPLLAACSMHSYV